MGAVVEQCRWWHMAVLADQHVGGSQELDGSSAGGIQLAAVLNLLLTVLEWLSVNCICLRKSARSISGSCDNWPGRHTAKLKTAWEGEMAVSSRAVAH